jgi:DnaJ-class molecular chaperone
MDHYATLGVSKNATPDEIKKAYRKLASQHHPDKGGDKAKFQDIQEAYSILSDTDKKAQYDNPQPQGFPGGFNFHTQGFDLNDIFGQMFQGQHNGPRGPRKQIYRTRVDITLQDAYQGTNKLLELSTMAGKKIIDIKVPKGVNQGDQMRFDNVMDNGMLIVEFNITHDLRFDRKGNDLYCNHSISVLDLIAGSEFHFKTISGKELIVTIKPKTQPYQNIRISGQGMPVVNTQSYGDQYILLKPFIPDTIDNTIIDSILRSRTN